LTALSTSWMSTPDVMSNDAAFAIDQTIRTVR
jgi:hypothetical protein